MIDLENAVNVFKNYVQKYNLDNGKIDLKIKHMLRVMQVNMEFAKVQKLDDENIELAGLIGLLHDIGRLVQLQKYDTFVDSESIDHALAGIEILFDNCLIRQFVSNDKYDKIIRKAIENHNKYEIEDGLNGDVLLHAKLIRDADKTDIYKIMSEDDPLKHTSRAFDENAEIHSTILSDFFKEKPSQYVYVKTVVDNYVIHIALIFNYYFKTNLRIIYENDYINKYTEKFLNAFRIKNENTLKNIEEVRIFANKYLEKFV